MKISNNLLRLAIGLSVTVVPIFVLMMFFPGDGSISCDDDSAAVAYARQLPKERLARLYSDLEKLALAVDHPLVEITPDTNGVLLEPFSDLQALRIKPDSESVTLAGCFDTFVQLVFHGFSSDQENHPMREIILHWGEGEAAGREVLWHEAVARER